VEYYNMKVIFCSILFLFLFASFGNASDADDRILEAKIKNSKAYRYGEATDVDFEKAKEGARRDLCQKIYVAITSSSDRTVSETESDFSDSTVMKTITYSALSLQNLGSLIFQEKNLTRAIAYIDTGSLTLSFDAAKEKVRDMVKIALQAETEGRIDDALKMLYWAYLRTHSYVGELDLELAGIDVGDARLAISEKMKQIADNLVVEAEPCYRKASSVGSALSFFYNGQPVQSLEFGYQCGDGDDYGNVENGKPVHITLYHSLNAHTYPLWLCLEYEYLREMRTQPEVINLYDIFKDKKFELNVCVDLVAPWIPAPDKVPVKTTSARKTPTPPKAKKQWSTTIEVLTDIVSKQEFDEALYDYTQSGKVHIAGDRSQLPGGCNIFVVILDQSRKLELLYLDNQKYKSVKTGKIFNDYHDAYKGDAMVIWMGEPTR